MYVLSQKFPLSSLNIFSAYSALSLKKQVKITYLESAFALKHIMKGATEKTHRLWSETETFPEQRRKARQIPKPNQGQAVARLHPATGVCRG